MYLTLLMMHLLVQTTRLEQEYRGLYRFFKGGADKLPSLKRESMFVQLLEGLSAEEAELLVLAKDGRINDKYKRITKTVISEAFPSIEWEVARERCESV